jgi:hypothetical protein
VVSVPTVPTRATGDDFPAADWGSYVKGTYDFLATTRQIAHLVQQTAQTGWTTATFTAITFGASSEVADRDGQHSTSSNTSRIVIGGTLGLYAVIGTYGAAGNNVATLLRAAIAFNGTRLAQGMSTVGPLGVSATGTAASGSALSVTTPLCIVASTVSTDYVEIQGYVSAASGTLGTSVSTDFASSLTAIWLGN